MPDSTGLRRLHRKRAGDPGELSRRDRAATSTRCTWTATRRSPAGASCGAFRRSSRRRSSRSRRTRCCGVLRFGQVPVAAATMGYKHRALDRDKVRESLEAPELPAEDHPARRRHAAHLRTRALLLRGRHRQRRVERSGGAGAVPPRARAGRCAAGAGGAFRRRISCRDLTLNLGTVVHDYLAT